MLFKILSLILGTVFFAAAGTPAVEPDDSFFSQQVEDLSSVGEKDFHSQYDCCVFYREIPKRETALSPQSVFQKLKLGEEPNLSAELYGKYYFRDEEGIVREGFLLGTQHTTSERLNEMIFNLKEERKAERATSKTRLNAIGTHGEAIEVGESWHLMKAERYDMSLDKGTEHYGYVSEWNTKYTIADEEYQYYLFGHETYLSPNRENTTAYRMHHLEYEFQVNHEGVQLLSYQPKSGTSFAEIYSPVIHDNGIMALDQVHLDFEYRNPYTNFNPYYQYNRGQSMQTAIYTIREEDANNDIVNMNDIRTITIAKKGFFHTSAKFTYTITHVI